MTRKGVGGRGGGGGACVVRGKRPSDRCGRGGKITRREYRRGGGGG